MFCPQCNSKVVVFYGQFYVLDHNYMKVDGGHIAFCEHGCAFVSEVGQTGMLSDAGALHLSDLEEPFIAPDPAPVMMFSGPSLLRRKES